MVTYTINERGEVSEVQHIPDINNTETDEVTKEFVEDPEATNAIDTIMGELTNEELVRILETLKKILLAKNSDYGNSFEKTFSEFGITSSIIRMSDKLNRFKNLVSKKTPQVNESIIDTLYDLAGYCILTIHQLRTNDLLSHGL